MFEGLFQPLHLLIVLGVLLLVFGPKRLPDLGKGMGEAIRGFKRGINEHEAEAVKPAAPSQIEKDSK
jgi:sec-independent protein translocase protein TatA